MPRRASSSNLQEYERKRDFRASPEPRGRTSSALTPNAEHRTGELPAAQRALKFVIQKHDATRLHYDFRLELDGALKSWAVPKGPSLNPADRRLAVMVEDHPLEYGGFEGVIPKGEYGGGEVIVWDRGSYAPLENDRLVEGMDAQEAALRRGLEAGKISILIYGAKLRGAWHLALIDTEKSEWVLLKKRDASARESLDVLALERSVLTGRTIEDVRAGRPGKPQIEMRAPPADIRNPMLATLVKEPFSAAGWIFEPKLDGMRAIAVVEQGRVSLYSRRGNEVTHRFPSLASELASHDDGDWSGGRVLDGEIVALDEHGAPSFERLQTRMHLTSAEDIHRAEREVPAIYYVFDLLWVAGADLRSLPLSERKALLDIHLQPGSAVRPVATFEAAGEEAFRAAVGVGYEGVVAKRLDSQYASGARSQSWLKVKAGQSEDFVIGGYTSGLGRRSDRFGALLVGQYDDAGKLCYHGKVGTGFDEKTLDSVLENLRSLRSDQSPFVDAPRQATPVVWVRPERVAEISFMRRTRDNILRAPVFVRLRDDKPPAEARPARVLEVPDAKAVPERPETSTAPDGRRADELLRALGDAAAGTQLDLDGHTISLTNLNKVFWPATKKHPALTKRDFLDYLIRVSPYLLPHLAERPLTLTRFPDGVTGKSFYQRHWEPARPPFLETVRVYSEHSRKDVEYLLCNNLATLIWLGQIADIELHTWFSRIDPSPDAPRVSTSFEGSRANVEGSILNYPDFIAFDLDPYTYSGSEAPGAEPELNRKAFSQVCRVARRLKAMLDSLGLVAYLKTSGKTGLHVYVPIVRRFTFDVTRSACETIGRYLMAAHPRDVTMTWSTSLRTGKVFFDHNMNSRSKSVVSIYSPRAVIGAGVSTPLRWEELDDIWPLDFNLLTVPERLSTLGDLWVDILDDKHDLSALAQSAKDHPVPA